MKAKITTEFTTQQGYKKYYLSFYSAKESERRLLKALTFDKPVYIGGAEPKFSLYAGELKKEVVEIIAPVVRAPARSIFEFWQILHREQPDVYIYDCICGMWFKNLRLWQSHHRKCMVLKAKAPLYAYIKSTVTYKEYDESPRKKKKKKRKDNVDTKDRVHRKRSRSKTHSNKVSKRSAYPNKKVRASSRHV